MKKNGFIATSLLYAFFLVFISLFIVLLLNFLHNRLLVQKIEEEARERLNTINNLTFRDLKVGDYIQISRANDNLEYNILSGEGMWQVYDVNVSGSDVNVKMLSDLLVVAPSVKVKLESDSINKRHPMAVQVFEEMKKKNSAVYDNELFKKMFGIDLNWTKNLDFSIVDANTLRSIRESTTIPQSVKRSLFNVKGSYIVSMNSGDSTLANAGYTTSYTYPTNLSGAYYVYKAYNFDNYRNAGGNLANANETSRRILNDYCGATFENDTLSYSYKKDGVTKTNPFGYVDVVDNKTLSSDKSSINTNKSIDFCYFASPVSYTHNTSDLIVIENENNNNDFLDSTLTPIYKLRFKLDVTFGWAKYSSGDFSAAPIINGGKGLPNDPYLAGVVSSSYNDNLNLEGCYGSGCFASNMVK